MFAVMTIKKLGFSRLFQKPGNFKKPGFSPLVSHPPGFSITAPNYAGIPDCANCNSLPLLFCFDFCKPDGQRESSAS
jgi:hypothetical protein